MRDFWSKIKQDISLEKVMVRIIMAWILTALLFYFKNSAFSAFNEVKYIDGINLYMYVCFAALFFAFFCCLGALNAFAWMDVYGPMVLLTLYGSITVQRHSEVSYVVGIMIVLAIAIVYATSKSRDFLKIKHKQVVIAVYVLAALFYIAVAGTTTVLRYKNYVSPAFDLGIWAQMFHYMKTTFTPVTTVERSQLLSHFAVHFSPVYYIYLPIYIIFPSAATLQMLQAITLASGIIPVYKLCKRLNLSKAATAAFGILFALLPVLATGCYYDLHENCFLVPFILWLMYYVEKDDIKGIVIFAILTMLVKEDAPVYVACVGLYMILGKGKNIKGAAIMIFSIVWFLVEVHLINKYGTGVIEGRTYSNYGGTMIDVIKNIFMNPGYVISECFATKKYMFILYMLMPIGFLPVITKKVSRFILFIPMILVNLAPDYQYMYSIFFQYAFGVLALLFYMAIVNYADMSDKARRYVCSFAICASILVLPICGLSKTYLIDQYHNTASTRKVLDEMTSSIPKDASVSATTFLVPHLADRDVLYEFPGWYNHDDLTEYVIIDTRYEIDNRTREAIDKIKKQGYELYDSRAKIYEIYKLNN